jgi:hypothetical protein
MYNPDKLAVDGIGWLPKVLSHSTNTEININLFYSIIIAGRIKFINNIKVFVDRLTSLNK